MHSDKKFFKWKGFHLNWEKYMERCEMERLAAMKVFQ